MIALYWVLVFLNIVCFIGNLKRGDHVFVILNGGAALFLLSKLFSL